MKLVVGILLSLYLSSALAENAFWRQGMTDESHAITVYRSATCGCCKGWIAHLEQHNFAVEDITVDSLEPYKRQYGVPSNAASCHTAVVDGVVIEGHVPAQDIKRLLSSEHNVRLLTVPAMPSGTPGMDTPGAPSQDFRVFAVSTDDEVSIFNEYSNY
jgi:hypothetical protein